VWSYSSIQSITSALDGVGGQRQTPAALTPREGDQKTLYMMLDGAQGWSGRVWKTSPSLGFELPAGIIKHLFYLMVIYQLMIQC
jgi:hypothetical protein